MLRGEKDETCHPSKAGKRDWEEGRVDPGPGWLRHLTLKGSKGDPGLTSDGGPVNDSGESLLSPQANVPSQLCMQVFIPVFTS